MENGCIKKLSKRTCEDVRLRNGGLKMSCYLAEITEANYREVLAVKQTAEQEAAKFVSPVVRSLADAWLYRNDGDVFPLAIMDAQQVVGFILLEKNPEAGYVFIWRLTIDQKYQGNGYGTQTLQNIIDSALQEKFYKKITGDYVEGNDIMKHIFLKLGFREVEFVEEYCEHAMCLELNKE